MDRNRFEDKMDSEMKDPRMLRTNPIKICMCGAPNSPQRHVCIECGLELAHIPVEEKPLGRIYALTDLSGKGLLRVNGSCTIGRQGDLSGILTDKSYAAREQACLWTADGQLYMEDLSNTNPTFVNNEQAIGILALKDGDEIGLGGKELTDGSRQALAAYILVKVHDCS